MMMMYLIEPERFCNKIFANFIYHFNQNAKESEISRSYVTKKKLEKRSTCKRFMRTPLCKRHSFKRLRLEEPSLISEYILDDRGSSTSWSRGTHRLHSLTWLHEPLARDWWSARLEWICWTAAARSFRAEEDLSPNNFQRYWTEGGSSGVAGACWRNSRLLRTTVRSESRESTARSRGRSARCHLARSNSRLKAF